MGYDAGRITTEYLLLQGECLLRILLAAVCGGIIGYERKKRGKEAGIRTHLIVAVASALMVIISKYGFSDISRIAQGNLNYSFDPSRVAAQIVSGIGFLGAGTIYFNRKMPKGLTTAAGIWATCGIGMAIGAGMYFIGFSATAILLILQLLLHKKVGFLRLTNEEQLYVVTENYEEAVTHLKALFSKYKIHIDELSFHKLDRRLLEIRMEVSVPADFDMTTLIYMAMKDERIVSIAMNEDYIRENFPKKRRKDS